MRCRVGATGEPLLALALATLALAACTGRVAVVRQSPEAIELRWANNLGTFDRAARLAQRHCGAPAALEQEFMDRDVTLARFACPRPGAVASR